MPVWPIIILTCLPLPFLKLRAILNWCDPVWQFVWQFLTFPRYTDNFDLHRTDLCATSHHSRLLFSQAEDVGGNVSGKSQDTCSNC